MLFPGYYCLVKDVRSHTLYLVLAPLGLLALIADQGSNGLLNLTLGYIYLALLRPLSCLLLFMPRALLPLDALRYAKG
jgi:hypothetical protein